MTNDVERSTIPVSVPGHLSTGAAGADDLSAVGAATLLAEPRRLAEPQRLAERQRTDQRRLILPPMRYLFTRAMDTIGIGLVRLGLSPNAVTLIGTLASVAAALWFFPRGELFFGTVVVTVFLLFDLVDGAMARGGGRVTRFGGVLDASCDRIVDGVLFGSLVWWALVVDVAPARGLALLICLVGAQVISYVRARAEANDIGAQGGLAERAVRFVVVLTGTGLAGLGVPYILDFAVWLLAALSVFTVMQRLVLVRAVARQRNP